MNFITSDQKCWRIFFEFYFVSHKSFFAWINQSIHKETRLNVDWKINFVKSKRKYQIQSLAECIFCADDRCIHLKFYWISFLCIYFKLRFLQQHKKHSFWAPLKYFSTQLKLIQKRKVNEGYFVMVWRMRLWKVSASRQAFWNLHDIFIYNLFPIFYSGIVFYCFIRFF